MTLCYHNMTVMSSPVIPAGPDRVPGPRRAAKAGPPACLAFRPGAFSRRRDEGDTAGLAEGAQFAADPSHFRDLDPIGVLGRFACAVQVTALACLGRRVKHAF